ncbi:hypothetical protein LRB59_04160 [Borreliella burgdorferi]|uniref:Uncharacterized protein n=2 Tax=Borreliella burgdorferi TaxID=139 RepID=O50934_BORBU|nr:hypothetical protein [Borreliella burgdorferi]AAC66251.1 conserved hypothetical protein [Borreliella burgdorferi B31]ACL33809.1 conserved hypothetical protein [Borreliella burgdorferi 156a]ACM10054.1 conserved hypothetical protein [Borreliella burgdorferi 72a]ACN55850.1 conserved hypothetical protein [Borreliella burgdorferi CA-11.2A]ACN92479.1 conserved hypothetical protein [Borreliella burgdorferi 94a]
MDESILNNDEYVNTVRDVLVKECPIPEYYHFLDSQQIQSSNISLGSDRIIKWYSNLTDIPTLKVNDFNTVSTIKFQRQIVKINYLPFQYAFTYYAPDGKVSVEANTNINMREGLLGAIIEIQKLMSAHYLRGGLTLSRGSKRTLLVDESNNETMYGLLNLPNQIDKTVKQTNILDQIKSINDDLSKINLEDERRVPFKILTTSKIKGRLLERLPNNNYSYKDMLFDFISAINNDADIELETTNLLDDEILIYPRSSKLLLLKDGHQPILNSYTEVSSSNFRTSFLDFSIGTILATKNSILRIKLS